MTHSIKDVLKKAIACIPESSGKMLVELNVLWQSTAGPILGMHSRVSGIVQQGVLQIILDSQQWIRPIHDSRGFIIQKFNDLSKNRYKIISLELKTERAKPPLIPNTITTSEKPLDSDDETVMRAADAIEDKNIREKFLRVYQALRYLEHRR